MSGSSSYNTFESEDESTGWLMTSETSLDDELSDELTLLNGDEVLDEDTLSFEALIKLSMRLKKQYNLREATVQLERCDKIWDTMQLLKKMQTDYESETTLTGDEDEGDEDDEKERKYTPSAADSLLPEGSNSSVPYIKYQPVQGNGNNALPNFYLAVKSQKKLYNCVTCGKQYSEKRSLRLHSEKEHGVVMPKAMRKSRRSTDNKTASQEPFESRVIYNSSSNDRDNSKSRSSSTSKNSTELQPQRKREGDTTASPFVPPQPKEEAEASPTTEETHVKTFVCPICDTAYRYQRGVTKHMMNVHDMTLAEAGKKYRVGEAVATKSPVKSETPSKIQEVKKEISRVKEETLANVDSGGTSNTERSGNRKIRYTFICKPCGQRFTKKAHLRFHARDIHDIIISTERSPPRKPDEREREYEFYKCEPKVPRADATSRSRGKESQADVTSRSRVKEPRADVTSRSRGKESRADVTARSRGKQTDKSYYATIVKDETLQPKTMRSGRQIGEVPTVNRPRRACAMNTSYTECTKEEEEVLQREFILTNVTEESPKPPASETTPCFLCKKAFVDIRKHLIDYHRINCPETILPLTEKAANSEMDNDSVDSGESVKNENIRMLHDAKGRKLYQCVMCSYKFTRREHIKRHHKSNSINGELQMHVTPKRSTSKPKPKILEDPAVDPLALTNSADSSKNEPRGNASDKGAAKTTGKKRKIGSSDKRLNSSSEHRTKRRKIEKPKQFENLGSESTSDSVQYNNEQKNAQYNNERETAQYNNERESALVMSETDCCFNEEDKSENPRDTRDSSDRDSGIGISITIKKRNNSYEVVEKDSGDDDKSKDFEHSKDDNTCSDSSSDATPVNFVIDDQETRRREILNSLDYSVEKNVVESVRDHYVDDNAFEKKSEEESCSSNDKETDYQWKEEEYYEEEACTRVPGFIPPKET